MLLSFCCYLLVVHIFINLYITLQESCESHDSSVQNGISHLCLELINDSFAKGHILSTTPKYTRMYQLGSLKTPSPIPT